MRKVFSYYKNDNRNQSSRFGAAKCNGEAVSAFVISTGCLDLSKNMFKEVGF